MRLLFKQNSRIIVWALLAIMLGSSAIAMAEEKIKLHYLTWATSGEDWIREDTIEPFQALHPNIEIEFEAVQFAEFLDKLILYQTSGNVPDLIHVSVGHLYDLARMGMLKNLQPWFDRDLNPSQFFLEPMKAVRYPSTQNGDLYAMPFAFVLTSLYYNKDMFNAAGAAYPDDSWTWETLQQVAPKMTRDTNGDNKNDQWGFWTRPRYDELDVVVHSFGGSLLSDDLRTVTFNSPAAVDATRFLVNLMWQDRAAPTPQESRGLGNLLSRNRVAMSMATINSISTLREHAAFDWDVALVPQGPEKRVVRLWPDSFAIPSGAKNAEAAWEYIKFAVTQTKLDRYSGERKVPIYKPLAASRDWMELDKLPNKMVFINSIQYGDPLEFRPAWNDWNSARTRFLDEAWMGTKDPATAVTQAAQAMQAVIDTYYEENK